MTGSADDPPLAFLVGTGRCGSSLVHEILARHASVGFISNMADRVPPAGALSRYNNDLYRRVPQQLTRKGRLRFAPSEAYRLLDAQVSPVIARPSRDLLAADLTPWLRRRLRAFFVSEATRQGRPLFTHKLTGWPRTGLLLEAFPDAKIVHVVRDGRAVANSLLQMPWWDGYRGPDAWRYGPLGPEYRQAWDRSGRSFVALAGLTWRVLMDAYTAAEAVAPADRWLTVRYEDVLRDPRAQFRRLLDFLGLAWTPQFERVFAQQVVTDRRTAAYLSDLSAGDVHLLESVLGAAMTRYGYLPGMATGSQAGAGSEPAGLSTA